MKQLLLLVILAASACRLEATMPIVVVKEELEGGQSNCDCVISSAPPPRLGFCESTCTPDACLECISGLQ